MRAPPDPGRRRLWPVRGFPLVYILLLAWLLIGPLWSQAGLPNSADGLLHLHRSAAVARSWTAGVLWPRWFPDVYQGFGAPIFHYYGPLCYLLIAPLHLLGLPLDLSTRIVISGFFIVSGLAAWAWLRRLLGPAAGVAGATLYLAQPTLFREYYFQGDYPQLLALFLLPVICWSLTRLYLEDSWFNRLLAPLSLALLAVTHNITAMLGVGVLGLYSLGLLLWRRDGIGWLRLVGGLGWGLGLSAFFWVPAVADMGLVRIQNLRQGFFDYHQYFVPWQDLLAAPPVLDSRAANPPFPHLLGWGAWLVMAAGIVTLVVSLLIRPGQRAGPRWIAVGLAIAAVCLLLTQTWSAPLWERVPLLPLVLFPSRFLGPAAIGLALVAGGVVADGEANKSQPLLLGLIATVVLSSVVFLFPHQPFLPVSSFSATDTQEYERRAQVWGTTSASPFLPRWAGPPEETADLHTQVNLPPGVTWVWETPHRAVLRPAAGSTLPSGALVLPVHYFPAWQVVADGTPLSIGPTAEGLVGLELPRPTQQVILHWNGTGWQRVGGWISLASLLTWLAWIGWVARCRAPRSAGPPLSGYRGLASLALLLLLILTRETIRALDLGWFQRSSPPGEVSGVQHRTAISLGGEGQPSVMLLGWELLSGPLKPASRLRLRLYWQSKGRIAEELHSLALLYIPTLQRGWAGVQNDNPGRIPTSRWRQALYYVDDLTLQLPDDLPPLTYTLAVGLVDGSGQRLAVSGNPDNLVLLGQVRIRPLPAGWRQPLHPQVATPARFGQSLHLQGYDLLPDPGGPILRLYWEARQTPPGGLVTFIHLLDDQGQLVAQFDGPPLEGLLPTDQWPVRSLLIDRRKLYLPDDLVSGQYRFLIGLYERSSGTRLAIQPEAGAGGHFVGEALVVPLFVPP